jgi:DNA-binding NarL/FixJ family response regulator
MIGLPIAQTEMQTLDLLTMLVDSSLLVPRVSPLREPRYVMLEPIRQFGLRQLQAEGERDDTYRALSRGLTDLAERARGEIGGPHQKPWIDCLDLERDTMRAVCEWAIQAHEPDIVLRLGARLWYFWVQHGNLGEGRDLLRRALSSPGPQDETLRANAIYNLGNIDGELLDYETARSGFAECLQIWERVDDRDGIASAHNGLGLLDRETGAYDVAAARFRLAAEIWRELGDEPGVAITTLNLGVVALMVGELPDAKAFLTQALAMCRKLDDIDRSAFVLNWLGQVASLDGRQDEAQALFRQSLETFVAIGDQRGETEVLYAMARRALDMGDLQDALRLFHDALAQLHARAERRGVPECIEGIAAIAAMRGNAAAAVRLLNATAAYRISSGAVAPFAERMQIERAWAAVRDRLDDDAIAEAARASQELSLDDLALDALRLLKRPADVTPLSMLEKLSAREQEVFTLLTQYLTDREIAERLFLSHRTVERHVGSILEKLGVKNRREAAALGTQRSAA